MRVAYFENNQTDISKLLKSGQRKLEIAFNAVGTLRDLPTIFMIPDSIFTRYALNHEANFFLNVNSEKDPAEWVIDVGERPL